MDLSADLTRAIGRLQIPHRDDLRRQARAAVHHARSVAFLAECGLVPDAKTRRYLDRAAVAEGMAIALPDTAPALFQLALDWTNHNCLLDDAVESPTLDVHRVAQLCSHYADALHGRIAGPDHHPLVYAMVCMRRRALELGVDALLLDRFAHRAERMAGQFVLERAPERHGAVLSEAEYLRQRIQAGPFDAWFALLDLVLGHRLDTEEAARLQGLAIEMNVIGNELRTCARELDQQATHNAILRAPDPGRAIVRMLEAHNASSLRFVDEVRSLRDPGHRAYARALARAVFATHQYELRSVRGCGWAGPSVCVAEA